jgi:hypothetical protein
MTEGADLGDRKQSLKIGMANMENLIALDNN